MSVINAFLAAITISFSLVSLTSAGDLIADINYGETRDTVANKLGKSNLVKSSIQSSFFARTGLNGVFTTTRALAGLKFSLYFDWTDSSGLKQITYRSDTMAASQYDQRVKISWQHAINILSEIYGRASNAGGYPKKSEISAGKIRFSHEWKISSGYIYLGVGQGERNYSINITFSKDSLQES